MRNMTNSPKTINSALEELGAELGISEADFGGKLTIEGKDPVVASRHHLGESMAILLTLFGMELAAIWKLRMSAPGLNAKLRPEFDLALVTATGPLGKMSVLPPQVDFSEFKLGPRFSGDPNGASSWIGRCSRGMPSTGVRQGGCRAPLFSKALGSIQLMKGEVPS